MIENIIVINLSNCSNFFIVMKMEFSLSHNAKLTPCHSFEHFTYVVYITIDERNVQKTNAHLANENIRQFAKPKTQSSQHKRVCGEQNIR